MAGNSDKRVDGPDKDAPDSEWESIRQALRGLQFGNVNIVVQDGVVMQIERTEKRRLRLPASACVCLRRMPRIRPRVDNFLLPIC